MTKVIVRMCNRCDDLATATKKIHDIKRQIVSLSSLPKGEFWYEKELDMLREEYVRLDAIIDIASEFDCHCEYQLVLFPV